MDWEISNRMRFIFIQTIDNIHDKEEPKIIVTVPKRKILREP